MPKRIGDDVYYSVPEAAKRVGVSRMTMFRWVTRGVPLNGFKELEGMNGINRFNIHRDYGNKTRLPSSHTCFNREFDSFRDQSDRAKDSDANRLVRRT